MMTKKDQIKEWILAIKPLINNIRDNIDSKSPDELMKEVQNLYRTIRIIRSVEVGKTLIQGFNFKKLEDKNG